jgi:hypothetical protein
MACVGHFNYLSSNAHFQRSFS